MSIGSRRSHTAALWRGQILNAHMIQKLQPSMLAAHVACESVFAGKRFAATRFGAIVWSLAFVHRAHVRRAVFSFSEQFVANWAAVRAFACVHSHVSYAMAVLCETLAAFATHIRSLTSVDSFVFCEFVFVGKHFIALRTLVRPFAIMDMHVCHEVALVCEQFGTLRFETSEWPFAGVCSHVACEVT